MAGDWIKIRINLHEDPAILKMAELIGGKCRPETVVGYCVRFWGWVSENTSDGVVRNVTLESVECVLHLPNFLSYMRQVGWLEYVESTTGTQIIIPNFERHLSNSAKKRALDTKSKRQQRVRKMSENKTDKSGTREEKRREEKSIKKKTTSSSCPRKFSDDDLKAAQWMWEQVLALYPQDKEPKPPNIDKWADTVRLIRQQDKRAHKQICEVFQWANRDSFWQKNIRSPSKLREQWDTLVLQMEKTEQEKATDENESWIENHIKELKNDK